LSFPTTLETQNEIAEYRLRLDRKRGQWVENNIPKEGGEPKRLAKNGRSKPTLKEAGIGHHESPKLRSLAELPEKEFAEIKIRAERRAGEMLKETEKHEGGRPTKNRSHDVTGLQPKLSDIGISKMQSSRWQATAELPMNFRFQGKVEFHLKRLKVGIIQKIGRKTRHHLKYLTIIK